LADQAGRRLLIVTYHFPPSAASGAYRLLGFARHLPAAGWAVSVVAPPGLPWEPSDPALANRVPAGTDVWPVPYPAGRWWAPARKLMGGYGAWLPAGLLAAARAARRARPAAVLTSGPPHVVHLIGLYLKRAWRLPWVADFRDPWVANELVRPEYRRGWAARAERAVVRAADLVVANAPGAARTFARAYPADRGKVVTLTNGFDPADPPPPAPPANGSVRVLHAGELYAGRDPRPYLDAVAALRAGGGPPVRTCLIGRATPRGVAGFDLGEEVHRRGLGGAVDLRGQVPYAEALGEMRRADLLLLLDTPGRTEGVPAKVYEYMGSGRPVLALAEPGGDTAAVLRASGLLHRVAPPKDVPAIGRALAELAAAVRAGQPAVADPAALGRFTRASLAAELAAHLDRITRRGPR
jgi:glycosyltransferase involved in cell wall biosynthesis